MAGRSTLWVHVAQDPYVSTVAFVCSQIEDIYAVNVWLSTVPSLEMLQKHSYVLQAVLYDKTARDDITGISYRIQEVLPHPEPSLQITSIQLVHSVNVGMEGAGDAIEATADVLDPLRRKQRWEQVRHDTAMNKADEKARALDLELKGVEVARAKLGMLNELVGNGLMSREEARSMLFQLADL